MPTASNSFEAHGRRFRISGRFGNFHVYEGQRCIAFGVMTRNDAENIASRIAFEERAASQ